MAEREIDREPPVIYARAVLWDYLLLYVYVFWPSYRWSV